MLRALKVLSVCFVVLTVIGNAQAAFADTYTYEMGPFHVEGMGATPAEAEQEAVDAMWEVIASVEAGLPENESVLYFIVLNEGMIGGSIYEIDFMLVIIGYTNHPYPLPGDL